MYLVEDSRQQKGKHEQKRRTFEAHGDHVTRCALPCGDYALFPTVSIDTKASMLEIAQNIGGSTEEHERFRRELIKAKENGCHLYVLIENDENIRSISDVAKWVNPRLIDSDRAITGQRLAKAMATMQERYGVTFCFCSPEKAGDAIRYILERGN